MSKIFKYIPHDWQISKFGRFIINSQNGIYKHSKYYGKGTPIVRITDFNREGNFVTKSFKRVIVDKNEINLYKLEPNNILINRVNSLSHIGKVALIKKLNEPTIFESNMIRIVLNKNELLPEFAFLYLLTDLAKRQFRRKAKRAVAQSSINQKDIKSIFINIPPNLKEQQEIIKIFHNLNKLIKSTQKIIDQLHLLKKGLMQRLFTQGIGHTEFKETKLGIIPENWNLMKIKSLGEVITGKTPSTKVKEYWDETGNPFVTPTNLTENVYISKTARYITEKGSMNSRIIPRNGVLVTCIASIGKSALAGVNCITNQQINSIICKKEINPKFIYYMILYKKKYLKRYAGEAVVPIIKKSLFEQIKLPIPPNLKEQNQISNILFSIDKQIENEVNCKENLKIIKRGLMQDLLTGKKRVNLE